MVFHFIYTSLRHAFRAELPQHQDCHELWSKKRRRAQEREVKVSQTQNSNIGRGFHCLLKLKRLNTFVSIGDEYVVNRRQRVKEVSTVEEKRLALSQSRAR